MNFEEFKKAALSTEKVPETLRFSLHGTACLLAAGVMMAKLADQMKKTMIYGKEFDEGQYRDNINKLRRQLDLMLSQAHRVATPEDTETELFKPNLRVLHGAIGMFGEAGEVLEAVIAEMKTGELDSVNVAEELGDSDWYKVVILDEICISEEESRTAVIEKLTNKATGRYKNGFSEGAALALRDTVAERVLLEDSLAVVSGETVI